MKKKKPFDRDKWLIAQLRRLSIKYPPRLEILNEGKRVYYITSKKGKQLRRVAHDCSTCSATNLSSTKIRMDHIDPVRPEGFTTIWEFANRLFCGKENWQKICLTCHDRKSEEERKIRAEKKKLDKK